MSKEMSHLVVGAGAVVLCYMAYKAFAKGTPAAIRPTNPGGATWTSVAPGEFLTTDQLIYGAATGSPYDTVPLTSDIFKSVTQSIYGGSR